MVVNLDTANEVFKVNVCHIRIILQLVFHNKVIYFEDLLKHLWMDFDTECMAIWYFSNEFQLSSIVYSQFVTFDVEETDNFDTSTK